MINNMLDHGVEQSTEFLFKVQVKFFITENTSAKHVNFGKIMMDFNQQLEHERQVNILKNSSLHSAKKELETIHDRTSLDKKLDRKQTKSLEQMELKHYNATVRT